MTEEKKLRGRPRKYNTNAERKKAYRERKKAERVILEERVKILEKKLAITKQKSSENEELISLTYKDIKQSKGDQLLFYTNELRRKIDGEISLFELVKDSIDLLMENFQQKIEERSEKNILEDFEEKFDTNLIKNLVLFYIIETEIHNRKQEGFDEVELDILEQQIRKIEEEITKQKELKIVKKISSSKNSE